MNKTLNNQNENFEYRETDSSEKNDFIDVMDEQTCYNIIGGRFYEKNQYGGSDYIVGGLCTI
ncbi:MAG: hypothetical protein ACK5K7_03190 [Bacilli bacterium]